MTKRRAMLWVLGCPNGNPEFIIADRPPKKKWTFNGYYHFGEPGRFSDSDVMDMKTARLLGADRIAPGAIRDYAINPAFDLKEETLTIEHSREQA